MTTDISDAIPERLGGDVPGPRSRAILAEAARLVHGASSPEEATVPMVLESKSGSILTDVDGNRFIDFVGGWGSTPLGADHPRVMAAAIAGLHRYSVENTDYVPAEPLADFARQLLAVAPSGLAQVAYEVSGTEAVETALKIMRAATGRPWVISFFGQYHGESYAAQALSAQQAEFHGGMRHLMPGYLHVPYPDPSRCVFRHDGPCDGTCVTSYIRDQLCFHLVPPEEIAGVFIEPIIGEGGVLTPPDGFWRELRRMCEENGWLLTLDEVETGLGRTGKLFAAEHWDLQPDIMCLAKGLSGGALPLGAVLMSERVASATQEVHTGGTWAGQPAACLAAAESLRVITGEGVLDNVATLEGMAHRALDGLVDGSPVVSDVRIRGLYLAVEFVDPRTGRRAPEISARVHQECVRSGLVGIQDDVAHYRGLPALNMSPVLFGRAMEILHHSIEKVGRELR